MNTSAQRQLTLYAISVIHASQHIQLLEYFSHSLHAAQHMLTLYPHARCVGVRPATRAEQIEHTAPAANAARAALVAAQPPASQESSTC